MRRSLVVVIALILVALAVYALWPAYPTVDLPTGNKLGILKISAGERHFYTDATGWRRVAADTLPQELLSRLGLQRNEHFIRHGALVLWLTEYDQKTKERLLPAFLKPRVFFADGRSIEGKSIFLTANLARIEFPIYPRADSHLKIQIRDGQDSVQFTIKNPNPSKLENWAPGPLPQTNFTGKMGITLKSFRNDRLYLRTATRDDVPPAWMSWRIEITDSVGNWEEFKSGSLLNDLSSRVYQPGPLKLTVHPSEYISAGYVSNAMPKTMQELKIPERARNLGFERLYLLGHGEYLFANSVPRPHGGLAANQTGTATNSASRWDVHLAAIGPNLTAIYDSKSSVASFDARLRERIPNRTDGRIFEADQPPVNFQNNFQPFHQNLRLTPIRCFAWEHIEAEIIARHRPVEFIISQQNSTNVLAPAE